MDIGKTLFLTADMRDTIIAHARAGYPDEVCGVLGGREGQAYAVRRLTNRAAEPHVRYVADPAEQVAAFEAFEEQGWEMVAIYHSHPHGPPGPSATDIAESYYPDVVYLIVSLADRGAPLLTAWTIQDSQAQPVRWALRKTD